MELRSTYISTMEIFKSYIIDDDEIFVVLTEIQLNKAGCFGEIFTFENGEDAIAQLKKDSAENSLPDFILLDLNMPIMDGWQFLEAYRELNLIKLIPVVIATSSIDPTDFERSKSICPVRAYISKPINNEKIEIIKEALKSKDSH